MVFAHTNGMGMIVARNRLCLNSNTYRALSSPQVEPHIHLTESSRPYPSSSITNYVQLSFNSAEPGYNQTFTKFVDCKKHEVTQSVDGYIYAWPGCDFATMMKTSYDIHFAKQHVLIHFIDFSTGEKRYICQHNDYECKTHNSALFTRNNMPMFLKRPVVILPPQWVRRD
ncbi:hypothetical protein BDR04DRAFT_1157978 [Suillus decipiens]|nr:hypothetical protein BDR04DRAFT_1157978 [Suillus decipiens]